MDCRYRAAQMVILFINNNISDSQTGIFLDSGKNQIYGNSIEDNVIQAEDRGINTWNAGYPVGGNLWSDYQGQDAMQGPGQNVPRKGWIWRYAL